jgi:hypothetical protein
MNMKDFAQYLQHKSFDKELHKIRKLSLERINANETSITVPTLPNRELKKAA